MNFFSSRRLKYWTFHPASFSLLIGVVGIAAFTVIVYLIDTMDSHRLGILVLTCLSIILLCVIGEYSFKLFHLLQNRNNHD